eukprot:620857-Prorocentrum_minimum.AAC.1
MFPDWSTPREYTSFPRAVGWSGEPSSLGELPKSAGGSAARGNHGGGEAPLAPPLPPQLAPPLAAPLPPPLPGSMAPIIAAMRPPPRGGGGGGGGERNERTVEAASSLAPEIAPSMREFTLRGGEFTLPWLLTDRRMLEFTAHRSLWLPAEVTERVS